MNTLRVKSKHVALHVRAYNLEQNKNSVISRYVFGLPDL